MKILMIRFTLFFIGIFLKTVATMSFMFQLNLVPIHTRTAEHYAEVFAVRMPFVLFAIGFALVVLSFYFPVLLRRKG